MLALRPACSPLKKTIEGYFLASPTMQCQSMCKRFSESSLSFITQKALLFHNLRFDVSVSFPMSTESLTIELLAYEFHA